MKPRLAPIESAAVEPHAELEAVEQPNSGMPRCRKRPSSQRTGSKRVPPRA
jgi:hypothetical protein